MKRQKEGNEDGSGGGRKREVVEGEDDLNASGSN